MNTRIKHPLEVLAHLKSQESECYKDIERLASKDIDDFRLKKTESRLEVIKLAIRILEILTGSDIYISGNIGLHQVILPVIKGIRRAFNEGFEGVSFNVAFQAEANSGRFLYYPLQLDKISNHEL